MEWKKIIQWEKSPLSLTLLVKVGEKINFKQGLTNTQEDKAIQVSDLMIETQSWDENNLNK